MAMVTFVVIGITIILPTYSFAQATEDDANPYCDKVPDNYQGICHDRKDYYDGGPNDGLYPCNDGTKKTDWKDCEDATESDD